MSILPLSAAPRQAQAEDMSDTASATSRRGALVLGDPLVLRPRRLADGLLARAFGPSLDRQLAAGRRPEAAPLLAARAQDIVSLPSRQALAANWDHLLRVASGARMSRANFARAGVIAAAEPAIRELTRRLSLALPVAAQGVAMASVLLTDATGPVYNPHSPVTLPAALEAAIAQLDPALPLMRA
jgi:hypothetical protein